MNRFLPFLTLNLVLGLTVVSSAAAATYGGDATGVEVTVTATGTTVRAATGHLSISGGMAEAALPVGSIPSTATGGAVSVAASSLHSAVVGTGGTTRAESSMGAIGVTVSGNQITSDFLMARSTASCGPSVAGSAQVANLVINGQTITVTGAPNQTVSLPNGTAVINAQVATMGSTSGQLSVTAVRVLTHDTITGQPMADVLLNTVDARIDCAAGSSPGDAWATGGGWITSEDLTDMATFGFVAGPTGGGTIRGHFTLTDHSTGATIHGTVLNSVTECVSGETRFDGTDSNGRPFFVAVDDNGEPGSTVDRISVDGFDQNGVAYSNTKDLSRGNIQNHGFACE